MKTTTATTFPREAFLDPQDERTAAAELGQPRELFRAVRALESSPTACLSSDLKTAKASLAKAEAAKQEAEAEVLEAMARNSKILSLQEKVSALRSDVLSGEHALEAARAGVKEKLLLLEDWNVNGYALPLTTALLYHERRAAHLPGWIARRLEMLAEAEAELKNATE